MNKTWISSNLKIVLFGVFLLPLVLSCDSAKDVLDTTLNPPERRPIDVSRTGVNSFFNVAGFGSTSEQFSDIKGNLNLRYVRVLFAWTDGVQSGPNVAPDFSFYDQIINSAPSGVELLVVLAHVPSWMSSSSNWDGLNPRATFVNRWVKPVVERYRGHGRISGYEIFNEPDVVTVAADAALGLTDPANYFELLSLGSAAIRSIDASKLVLNAATESINKNFPNKLLYNQQLVEYGAVDLVDVWNVHFYGKQFERVVQANGIADFLKSIPRPVWVTESGDRGVNNQLPYVELAWPFLMEEIPNIDRFYYYDYASAEDPANTFSMRTLDSQFPVSDLYVHLTTR